MSKLRLSVFDKIILLIAIFLAIGLLLGFSAGKFDPREYILVAFFGLAYPFFLLANVILVIWWAFRKKWLLAILTTVLIFSGWSTMIATLGFRSGSDAGVKGDAGLVRLMTYNVHNFKVYGENNKAEIKTRMFNVVRAENPDIICFQEFYTRYKGPYNTIDSLKKILKAPYFYFEPSAKNDYEAIGLAIFSRYPIKNKGSIIFEPKNRGNESIFADLDVKGKTFRIYNVHLQSISFDKQDYDYIDMVTRQLSAEVKSSRRILSLLKNAFKKRSEQVDIMKENLAKCTYPYAIAGDFNDTPGSYAVTQLTRSLNNAFVEHGSGLGRTYNGKFPNFQIDYIATSKEIGVMNYHVSRVKISDHFPVRSDLKMRE